jgi:hypothetical protein
MRSWIKSRGIISDACANFLKTMCRQIIRTEGPTAGHPLYLAICDSYVSVRFLHDFPRVHCRSISGSLLHWRISGGSETFPEQSQARVVIDSHRGMAAQRSVAAPLLPDSPPHGHNIYTLAARDHGRRSGQNPRAKCQNPRRNPARRASETTQGKTVQADGKQTQPGSAGVLGDACGDAELERNDTHALRRGDESLEVQPAPLARPDR